MSDVSANGTPNNEPENTGDEAGGPPFSFRGDPGDNVPQEVLAEFQGFFQQQGGSNDGDEGSGTGGADSATASDSTVEGEQDDQGQQAVVPPASEGAGTDPDGGPVDAGDQGPGVGSGEATPPEPAGEQTEQPSGGYTWVDGEQSQTFDDDTVRQALYTLDWARSLPDEGRAAIAAVTNGQGVVIARADYEAFQQWQAQQSAPQPQQQTQPDRDADLRALDLEPDALAALVKTRDDLDALKSMIAQQAPQEPFVPQDMQQTVNANMDNTVVAFDTAIHQYAENRGMTPQEMELLAGEMVSMNIIPTLAQQMATIHPVTGQVIAPAPVTDVVSQAMDTALLRNPNLWETLMTRAQSAPAADGSTPPTPAGPVGGDDVITAKKARAASVASAPSATTTPAPRRISQMGNQEVVTEIAAYLDNLTTG